jgi:tetracycline repressor-like protein
MRPRLILKNQLRSSCASPFWSNFPPPLTRQLLEKTQQIDFCPLFGDPAVCYAVDEDSRIGNLLSRRRHSLEVAKVVKAVEHACRANRGAAVKVLVAAVVEAFVNAKLERTDISTALYAAAAEPEGAAVVRRLSKRVHRALTAALADAAGPTLGDMEFVALMLYSAMAGATRAVLEAGAPPKMVIRLHEELLVLCQGYAAKSVGSS